MGIYIRTVFYKDVRRNKSDFVILAEFNSIIENCDKEHGYVIKEELLKHYGHKIQFNDIGEHSRVEEHTSSTYGPDYQVHISLPVRSRDLN